MMKSDLRSSITVDANPEGVNQYTGGGVSRVTAPSKRPDGRPVVTTAPAGTPAAQRGFKVNDKSSYQYHDMHGTSFRGNGHVAGFVNNGTVPPSCDVVIHDHVRNAFVFVDSKNVQPASFVSTKRGA